MDVKHLEEDFVRVECEVRGIPVGVGDQELISAMAALVKAINEEGIEAVRPILNAHTNAKKNPKQEVLTCYKHAQSTIVEMKSKFKKGPIEDDLLGKYFTKLYFCHERLNRMVYSRALKDYLPQIISPIRSLVEIMRKVLTKEAQMDELTTRLQNIKMPQDTVRKLEDLVEEILEDNLESNTDKNFSSLRPMASTSMQADMIDTDKSMSVSNTTVNSGIIPIKLKLPELSPQVCNTENYEVKYTGKSPLSQASKSNSTFQNKIYSLDQVSDSKFFRDPNKWNIRFEGSRSGIPVERFFYRVERFANKAQISAQQLVDCMSVLLSNEALDWYWLYIERNPHTTWEEFRDNMIQRFKSNQSDDDIIIMINQRKQLYPKESFQEYYDAIIKMTLLSREPLSDREIYHVLRRNMRPGLQMEISKNTNFSSLAHFARECVELESRWKRFGFNPEIGMNRFNYQLSNYQRQVPRVNEAYLEYEDDESWRESSYTGTQESPQVFAITQNYNNNRNDTFQSKIANNNYRQGSYSFANNSQMGNPNKTRFECWNCSSPDHNYFDCRQPIRGVFCFGCGRKGVLKPDCGNCKLKQENWCSETPNTRDQRLVNFGPRTTITKEEAATNTDPELYRMQKQNK